MGVLANAANQITGRGFTALKNGGFVKRGVLTAGEQAATDICSLYDHPHTFPGLVTVENFDPLHAVSVNEEPIFRSPSDMNMGFIMQTANVAPAPANMNLAVTFLPIRTGTGVSHPFPGEGCIPFDGGAAFFVKTDAVASIDVPVGRLLSTDRVIAKMIRNTGTGAEVAINRINGISDGVVQLTKVDLSNFDLTGAANVVVIVLYDGGRMFGAMDSHGIGEIIPGAPAAFIKVPYIDQNSVVITTITNASPAFSPKGLCDDLTNRTTGINGEIRICTLDQAVVPPGSSLWFEYVILNP